MSDPPFLPEARAYRLRNARVPGAFLTGGVPAGATLDGDGCALLDIVVADELRTVLWPGPTDDDDESWAMRGEAWQHPSVLIGGSDAGAHLDRMCGAPYTTQWLGDCLRGRKLATLEAAVHQLTGAPASLFGLVDRGVIAEGAIDVYPRFAPTSEWDTGAAQCVVEAAGGAVVDPRGRPLSYNQRDTILNGDFIALGDTSLPWRDWLDA